MGADYSKKDRYAHAAKRDGYSARSAYKLEELDQKFKLLRPGCRVVDLGAAPGSWMQYTAKIVLPKGYLLGLDLSEITAPLPQSAVRAQLDVLATTPADYAALGAEAGSIDVVLSDMAPKVSGIKVSDRARSLELVQMGYEAAKLLLRAGGSYVFKVFVSQDYQAFERQLKASFARVVSQRPEAVRSGSEERFVVCLGYHQK